MLYELTTGLPPFSHNNKKQMFQAILTKPLSFPGYISETLKSLIIGLTEKDPTKRLGHQHGIKEILEH